MDPRRAKERLLKERERLVEQIRQIDESGMRAGAKDGIQELSLYDNHPADVGTETFERGKDLGVKDNLEILLKKTDAALRKFDEGTWGICERCGGLIDSNRLEAMPSATLCVGCAEELESIEKTSDRPVEEGVVRPPYGYRHGEKRDVVAYDGIDTWEDVAVHGSSYTPQDQPGAVDYDHIHLEEPPDAGVVQRVEGLFGSDHDAVTDEARKRRAHGRRGQPH